MKRHITAEQRVGQYQRIGTRHYVDMRHGYLIEDRGGKNMGRAVFYYLLRGKPVVVTRIELCREWIPRFGSHICGDAHNKQPDLLAPLGDHQNTSWEKWREK